MNIIYIYSCYFAILVVVNIYYIKNYFLFKTAKYVNINIYLLTNINTKHVYRLSSYGKQMLGHLIWPKYSYKGVDIEDRVKNDMTSKVEFKDNQIEINYYSNQCKNTINISLK